MGNERNKATKTVIPAKKKANIVDSLGWKLRNLSCETVKVCGTNLFTIHTDGHELISEIIGSVITYYFRGTPVGESPVRKDMEDIYFNEFPTTTLSCGEIIVKINNILIDNDVRKDRKVGWYFLFDEHATKTAAEQIVDLFFD